LDTNAITITDESLFEQIKAGRHELLDTLYSNHRAAFIRYATQQLFANEEDAADCFQDAVIVFYKNVVSGRLTELTCSIRTYLFAVGKRIVYKRNTQRRREAPVDLEAGSNPSDELDLSIYERIDNDHLRENMLTAIGKLGETCQKILQLAFYHRYPIESIQNEMGFKTPGAVRIKKMRCLGELKKFIQR
jgi:RNA polymerase sigma factor (sigma-70 family)